MRSALLMSLFLVHSMVAIPAVAQVSVGWGSECDYDVDSDPQALQSALDDGAGEVRLTYQNDYEGAIDIAHSVTLRGGFADCDAADSNSQDTIRSTLDGSVQDRSVVRMADIDEADIRLQQLTIRNGDGVATNRAGGLDIRGLTGLVALDRLDIRDNSASTGGGISIRGLSNQEQGLLTIVLTATAIRDNTANRGGGLHCDTAQSSFDIAIEMLDGTTLRGNHATQSGGAIRMSSCRLDFEAGIADSFSGSNLDAEIFQNTSDVSGAGLALFGPARVKLLGTVDQPFDVSGNEANLDDTTSGAGGAAQVSDDAELEVVNGYIVNNSSGRYGGALFAGFGGRISVRRHVDGCTFDAFCSRIVANRLTRTFPGGGGALAARYGGEITVVNSLFHLNSSDDRGYIGFAEQSHDDRMATLRLEGNVIHNNGQLADDSNSTAIRLGSDAKAVLAYNTFSENKDSTTILSQRTGSSLQAVGNILDELANIHEVSGEAEVEITCNLVRSLDTIEAPVTDTFEGSPEYVDPAGLDFRLAQTDTIAMDVCSNELYQPGPDLDGEPRGLDHPDVTDLRGPFDLGAHEFDPETLDFIFSDAFER